LVSVYGAHLHLAGLGGLPFADLRLAPSTSASEFPAVKVSVIAEQSADIDAAKLRVRTAARSNRDALSSGLGAAAVTGVAARFMSQEELAPATGIGTVVSGYAPIGSEIDPRMLMERIAARGASLCLPDVTAPEAPLVFRHWKPGDVLRTGAHDIPVPAPDADPMIPDVLLVPMLAFDRFGHRLGYGVGYYDRTIAALREVKTILTVGLAFSGQVRDDLPVGPHDMVLDWIVTESAALRVAA
jgi:5-formyltetrahydrofolate cyclo-ligase